MYPTKKLQEILDKSKFTIWKIKTSDYLSTWKNPIIDQWRGLIAWYSNNDEWVYNWKLPVIVYWDHTNIIKYIDFPFIWWADWIKILSFNNNCDVKYCYYLLETFKPETQWYRRHFSFLKEIDLPLPPLPTQKLIIQKLDSSFENINKQIDLIKTNLSSLEELNKSVLEKVFSEWFNEYKLKKILEIADVKSWKRLPKWEKVLDEKTDYPYIRVSDFWDNWTIDSSNIKYISEKVYKSISNYIITDENLYISIAWTIWKTGIIPKQLNWANLTENAVRLVYKNKSEIFNNYIYYFTISENFKKQAWLATRAVAMPKLAITRLKEIQIPLPPLQKQKEIVSYLDQIFAKNKELKTKYESQLKELEELKQSLLKDAFEGKLAI